jgi:hypothetical protein
MLTLAALSLGLNDDGTATGMRAHVLLYDFIFSRGLGVLRVGLT